MSHDVRPGDLGDPRVRALLSQHIAEMQATSPACSVHTLGFDDLAEADVRILTVWDVRDGDPDGDVLLGCGALKLFTLPDGARAGELKSMRTSDAARRRGVASTILDALTSMARDAGVTTLFLETGPQATFAPARALYAKHGFVECEPFGSYTLDPYSVFMTRPVALG